MKKNLIEELLEAFEVIPPQGKQPPKRPDQETAGAQQAVTAVPVEKPHSNQKESAHTRAIPSREERENNERRARQSSGHPYAREIANADIDTLRKAFVFSEILGPPTALKDPESNDL